MGLRQDKRTLRRQILALRDGLDTETLRRRSAAVRDALFPLNRYRSAKTVHLFVPFGSEVDTRPILEELWAREVRTVLPRVASNRQLDHLAVTDWNELEPGAYSIPEPMAHCPTVSPKEVELVLVPGVAFDRTGGRLGYGGGYYDRFLDACPAPRVALAFALQIVPEVPRESHDLLVDDIITDQGRLDLDRPE
jgi:5-formyltetrahydrofolate cyclo-ligase